MNLQKLNIGQSVVLAAKQPKFGERSKNAQRIEKEIEELRKDLEKYRDDPFMKDQLERDIDSLKDEIGYWST